jgi:FkbM family methyltransferase
MRWQSRLFHRFRWKLVHGSKLPKANLPSCLLNLASRGFEPRQIIDVGANRGKWSRDASRVFPNAGYTLIEPQVEMESRLKKFCGGYANRRYLLAGAGSFVGELPFTVVPDTVSSTFVVTAEQAARQGLEQRTIPLVTVDHVVRTIIHAIPDIVKVDAEGFEQEVVKGSQSVLGKTEVFFLEAHFLGERTDPSEFGNLVSFMADFDYVPYDFSWLGRRKFDNALWLCEIAFVRRHGFLRSLKPGSTTVYVPETLGGSPRSSKAA